MGKYITYQPTERAQWTACVEHTPPIGRWVAAYCEIHGRYYLASHSPVFGWHGMNGEKYQSMTHWWDGEIPFPFAMKKRSEDTSDAFQYYARTHHGTLFE